MGYINHLVEQIGCKVILLANEEEFKDETYKNFKEKVIGKTYEVQQNLDTILDRFLQLATEAKPVLSENRQDIKNVYLSSTYQNLRHLRHAIIDFEYLYSFLGNQLTQHSQFMQELVKIFFALTFEVRKGTLLDNHIQEFGYQSWMMEDGGNNVLGEEASKSTKFEIVMQKYNLPLGSSLLTLKNMWINVLIRNCFVEEDINQSLLQTSYFEEERETWQRLSNYWEFEDEEYKKVLNDVVGKFHNNEYVEHKQLLFIVSLLLFLSKQGLYDMDPQDISQQAKANIAKLSNHPIWKTQKYEGKRDDPWNGYHYHHTSYSYKDPQSQHFTGIRNHLEEKASEVFQVGLADQGKDLLSDLQDGNMATIEPKLEQDFQNIAIFCHLDKNKLKEAILKMSHRA